MTDPTAESDALARVRDLLTEFRSDQYRVLDSESDPFRQGWRQRSVEVVEALDAALTTPPGTTTPEGDAVVRIDRYTVRVDGRPLRVTPDQEQRLRAMDAGARARFLAVMGFPPGTTTPQEGS